MRFELPPTAEIKTNQLFTRAGAFSGQNRRSGGFTDGVGNADGSLKGGETAPLAVFTTSFDNPLILLLSEFPTLNKSMAWPLACGCLELASKVLIH